MTRYTVNAVFESFRHTIHWNGTITDWHEEISATGMVEIDDNGVVSVDQSTVTYEDECGNSHEPYGRDEDLAALALADKAEQLHKEATRGLAQ